LLYNAILNKEKFLRIHTLEDKVFELNTLPDEIDDLRFAILDNSDKTYPDFRFVPLIFLESFTSPALVLRIGDKSITMPVDWQILIGEEEVGDLEALPLTAINDRDFNAFSFNALSSFSAEFLPIEILDVYDNLEWFAPKLKNGHYLAVPLDDSDKPRCVYFIKDVSRNSEVIEYKNLW